MGILPFIHSSSEKPYCQDGFRISDGEYQSHFFVCPIPEIFRLRHLNRDFPTRFHL